MTTSKAKTSEPDDIKDQIDKAAKLFDVAEPGKTPAPATSRPIIVGHSGGLKRDPMVVEGKPEKQKPETEPKSKPEAKPEVSDEPVLTVKSKVIKPLSAPASAEKTEDEPEAQPKTEPSKPEPEAPKTPAPDTKAPVVDTLISQLDPQQTDKKQAQDLANKGAETELLIASQKYFVPIGLASRRRSHYRVMAVLIVLVIIILAGLNFALDAEVIDSGISPLTNIL